jgi:hypothetical protein
MKEQFPLENKNNEELNLVPVEDIKYLLRRVLSRVNFSVVFDQFEDYSDKEIYDLIIESDLTKEELDSLLKTTKTVGAILSQGVGTYGIFSDEEKLEQKKVEDKLVNFLSIKGREKSDNM